MLVPTDGCHQVLVSGLGVSVADGQKKVGSMSIVNVVRNQGTGGIHRPQQSANVIPESVEHFKDLEDFVRRYLVDKGKQSEKHIVAGDVIRNE